MAQKIHWSYAWLIATRMLQEKQNFSNGQSRNYAANKIYGKLNRSEMSIGSLERDLFQAMTLMPCCAHCGSVAAATRDHLIPQARGGGNDGENIVISCGKCNSSRRDMDLMKWYCVNKSFPTLVLLRQYLKVCRKYSLSGKMFDLEVNEAVALGLPFDPNSLPEIFPPLEKVRYDFRGLSENSAKL